MLRLLISIGSAGRAIIIGLYFRKLSKLIKNKSIYITCSAPTSEPPKENYDLYVAVSSAINLLSNSYGITPDLWICDASIWHPAVPEINKSKSALSTFMQGSNAKNILSVCSNSWGSAASPVNIPVSHSSFLRIPIWLRCYIVNKACSTMHLDNMGYTYKKTQVGTGIWSICCIAFLQPKKIFFTGINLKCARDDGFTTYFYDTASDEELSFRNHTTPDVTALGACFLNSSKKIEFSTNESELKPCIQSNLT